MQEVTEDVKKKVFNTIYRDSRVDVSDVKITVVDEGTVILTGSVHSYAAKKAAEMDAFLIPEVKEVNNRLTVAYPSEVSVSDDELSIQAQHLLMQNPEINAFGIDILVDDEVVTLEGEVGTYRESVKAEDIVSNLRGVRSVKNNLKISPVKTVPDEEIKKDISAAYSGNPGLDDTNISVSVDNAVVTLEGTVSSAYEKILAENTALFSRGVKRVKNHIKVEGL